MQKKDTSPKNSQQGRRALIITAVVFSFLFLSAVSVLAYQYVLKSIPPCSVGTNNGICFQLDRFGRQNRAVISNIDKNKKYRLVIKKKTKKGLVEVANTVIDLKSPATKKVKSAKLTCVDPDGGKNFYVGSTVTNGGSMSKEDMCQGNILIEYYCDGGEIKSTPYICPWGCDANRCLRNASTTLSSSDLYGATCTDDSNCADGLVCKESGPAPYLKFCCPSDKCAALTDGKERYSNAHPNGFCINSGESDVLFSRAFDYRPTIRCVNGSYKDSCYPKSSLMIGEDKKCCNGEVSKYDLLFERFRTRSGSITINGQKYDVRVCCGENECGYWGVCYSEGKKVASTSFMVDKDYICKKGEWLEYDDNICTDTDSGADYNVFGTTRWPIQGFMHNDYCDGDTLIEGFCDKNGAQTERHLCENGCKDGRCLTTEEANNAKGWGDEICFSDNECGDGLICKFSGRYPEKGDTNYSARYCCHADECASVIPGDLSGNLVDMSTPGAHCVSDGGTDDLMGGGKAICHNGEYCYTGGLLFDANAKCCSGKTLKEDIWWENPDNPNAKAYVCCDADECAGDGVCFPNGDTINNPDKKCVNGVWEDL